MNQKNREPGFYWVKLDLHDDWRVAEWKVEPFMRPCWFLIDYEGDCYDDDLFEIDERRIIREEPSK